MQNLIGVHTRADVMAVYQHALLDKGLANRLGYLRSVPDIIKGQGTYAYAEYAMRWAQEALKEAKEAGLCANPCPEDYLALAAMAISGVIVSMGAI